jgi:hypothetical protein
MSEVEEDDLLFGEADRWVREIDKCNWVPTSPIPPKLPNEQESILGVLGYAIHAYKDIRRQCRAAVLAFPRLEQQLREAKQGCDELMKKHDLNPDHTVLMEELGKLILDEPLQWEIVRKDSIETDYNKVLNSFKPLRQKKREAARNLLHIVERAKISGAIKNENLTKRLLRCESNFDQLSEDYKSLLTKYDRLLEEKGFRDGHVKPANQPSNRPNNRS